jgi:hypothetical protein
MQSPVLFIVFNRPDTTRKVFEAIRLARPPRLYIAADGPRADRPDEIKRCEEVRKIATSVDWPCEIKTLFREKNLGCRNGVSSGIDWFFQHEPEGIILEDDILPLPSFFIYCEELLERYRENTNIGMISGCNLVANHIQLDESYFFSKHNHIWGWASWRRAWKYYDLSMKSWPEWDKKNGLRSVSHGNKLFEIYWKDIFKRSFSGQINTWDYQWTYTCWKNSMLTALPVYNQTYNLGFGLDATHTTMEAPAYVLNSKPKLLIFPLVHPNTLNLTSNIDELIDRNIYRISYLTIIKRFITLIPYMAVIAKKIKIWILRKKS